MANLTRIEEVTKQIREALWMAYCSGRANNKYVPEEVLPDLLKRCQLFPQPLDDKELRGKALLTDEEIAIIYKEGYYSIPVRPMLTTPDSIRRIYGLGNVAKAQLDKALALLQPKIEEAKRQGKKKAVEFIESYLVTTVHPEGDMHHIDDKEWQSVKLRLLRQVIKGRK